MTPLSLSATLWAASATMPCTRDAGASNVPVGAWRRRGSSGSGWQALPAGSLAARLNVWLLSASEAYDWPEVQAVRPEPSSSQRNVASGWAQENVNAGLAWFVRPDGPSRTRPVVPLSIVQV